MSAIADHNFSFFALPDLGSLFSEGYTPSKLIAEAAVSGASNKMSAVARAFGRLNSPHSEVNTGESRETPAQPTPQQARAPLIGLKSD